MLQMPDSHPAAGCAADTGLTSRSRLCCRCWTHILQQIVPQMPGLHLAAGCAADAGLTGARAGHHTMSHFPVYILCATLGCGIGYLKSFPGEDKCGPQALGRRGGMSGLHARHASKGSVFLEETSADRRLLAVGAVGQFTHKKMRARGGTKGDATNRSFLSPYPLVSAKGRI